MKKIMIILSIISLVIIGLTGTTGIALAAPPEKVDAFVCPVWNPDSQAGMMNPNAHPIAGGYYTIVPGENTGTPRANHLSVPAKATNQNGDGHPTTPGFGEPGDIDYTAIWEATP